ncbi:hypothetical protein MBCUT_08680 [Methanobrevibacter cuticularis]|uniref:Undecaprenyldiphospho-muramoylpentapeptide beta-N-acetylglucosaminyltransferase n=1 Tax=Methanobrevibacter cuticularis TaxID=47311 RepID=A0A166E831_9EURY|nr:hypothetical protein [Methanobrevibacter cuticularis]KZX16376.1 hypothetical protein MBCUT_08680 [Methanobrevibacter cuticularis]
MEDQINIAIACELAPAKTIIPIIKRIKFLEKEEKDYLNWNKSKIIGLTHGKGVKELLKPYCNEIYSIGQGRGGGKVKRNNLELASLIIKDIFKAIKAMRGKNIDLLVTCGNAGDVRKSIAAANFLKIPIIHIEQDIYNPIEFISYANLVTLPSKKYEDYFENIYHIDNVVNIGGYPMANYVKEYINDEKLEISEEISLKYAVDDFILIVLGGDLKITDLKELITSLENLDFPVIIAPYRFKREQIESLITSNKIKVLDEFVDLLSLLKEAKALIYGAGMGMTIEAGVLEIPSIKIAGFHKKQGSVDLAKDLAIPILEISDLPKNMEELNKLSKPNGKFLIENSELAIENLVDIINDFDFNNLPKKSGLSAMRAIWKKRSEFR